MRPQEIRIMQGYYSRTDVARRIGISDVIMHRMVYGGEIPEPTHQWGGSKRKYYVEQDLKKIKQIIGLK